jgi:single-strand DNA-binding protein|tara:strand:- start:680 stop:1048 length:369 start_codon:yes stop_codon:yes gene_type:complete
MNKVLLYGNVGKAPKFNTTGQGTPQAKFSLAPREIGKKGEDKRTNWVQCVSYGKTAELIRDYVGQGDSIIVEDGKLETITLDKKPGQEYADSFTRVRVDRVQFVKRRGNDAEGNNWDNAPFN